MYQLSMCRRMVLITTVSLLGHSCLNPAAASGDWGYEEDKPAGLRAEPAQLLNRNAGAARTSTYGAEQNGARYKGNVKQDCSITYWLKLYSFASNNLLTEDQKARLTIIIKDKLHTPQDAQTRAIVDFWPRLESAMACSRQQKENYRYLLRALLRRQARKEPTGSRQAEFIDEILGPVRIAATGQPPLTEEAVDAYADMACFLYEQAHPGKTVNAIDNKMVFASVIRNKFMQAPAAADRAAMANFDLAWARFKILFAGADEIEKRRLLGLWEQEGATTCGAHDPTLQAVLDKGPWH